MLSTCCEAVGIDQYREIRDPLSYRVPSMVSRPDASTHGRALIGRYQNGMQSTGASTTPRRPIKAVDARYFCTAVRPPKFARDPQLSLMLFPYGSHKTLLPRQNGIYVCPPVKGSTQSLTFASNPSNSTPRLKLFFNLLEPLIGVLTIHKLHLIIEPGKWRTI
jgi:hypothetical protein